ncbi:MAG: DUF4112 domain-containing protein [Bacteroidota bacterium]
MNEIAEKTEKSLIWLEHAADILDNRFRIPGTQIRFGIEAIIGLFPYVGDVITFIVSGFLLILLARQGISGKLVLKMIGNIWIDGAVGTVPLLGDIFDFRYKANRRNVELVKEHFAESRHGGSAWWIILLILFMIFLLLALSVFALWWISQWLGMQMLETFG